MIGALIGIGIGIGVAIGIAIAIAIAIEGEFTIGGFVLNARSRSQLEIELAL